MPSEAKVSLVIISTYSGWEDIPTGVVWGVLVEYANPTLIMHSQYLSFELFEELDLGVSGRRVSKKPFPPQEFAVVVVARRPVKIEPGGQ